MYSFLHDLLKDRKGADIFTLFSGWHFLYIVLTALSATFLLLIYSNKNKDDKLRLLKTLVNISFGLYILDIFLMPLAYNEIDIEKLPFHACTAMCVACFLSYYAKPLEHVRSSLVLLGFISNFVYLVYPAGVMWHATHPISYRVIQTLTFHAIMTVYCLLALIYEERKSPTKAIVPDLSVVFAMTLWALIGNYVYNGTYDGYSHFFNWFFVVRDPFYALPENVAPFVMPFINIALFFSVGLIVRIAIFIIKSKIKRSK